ncbi:MAG: hypothetical protein WCO42_02140 [bacterium]
MAAVCLTGLMAGCATTGTTVVSKTEGGRVAEGQRLLVVSQLASLDEAWAGAFAKAIVSELRKVGSPAQIQSRSPLALQSDKVRYADQIAEFKPDLVLVIEPGDGMVDARGRSFKRTFEAGVFRNYAERGRRDLSWRGKIVLEPAGAFVTADDMPALARDLVARMMADGVLPKPRRIVIISTPVTSKATAVRPESTRGFGR